MASVADLQKAVEQYRVKPENAASLADGRVIDVSGTNGEVFISIGSKQRVQPGMTFDVYDSPAAITINPTTGENTLALGGQLTGSPSDSITLVVVDSDGHIYFATVIQREPGKPVAQSYVFDIDATCP